MKGLPPREREIAYDQSRDAALRDLGYRVLRVANDDVYRNIESVVETILVALTTP